MLTYPSSQRAVHLQPGGRVPLLLLWYLTGLLFRDQKVIPPCVTFDEQKTEMIAKFHSINLNQKKF